MKAFEMPVVEVVEFSVEDVVTASMPLPPIDGMNVGDSCI